VPYHPSLDTTFVIAGGLRANGKMESYSNPPLNRTINNLYLDSSAPNFDGAYTVRGNSVSHGDIIDGDVVLYKDSENMELKKGSVVALPANLYNTINDFHEDWLCLRVVEEILKDEKLKVSSSNGNDIATQTVETKDVRAKIVYAFSVE